MKFTITTFSLVSVLLAKLVQAQEPYNLLTSLQGDSFLSTDNWEYAGHYDNLTNGDVMFVNQSAAEETRVAYVNSGGNVILRVDNTTNVPYNEKRNSVYLKSTRSFPIGTVLVLDAYHIPYGCSVWPAFFTQGENWPEDGEIDILETINLMQTNQYALHTTSGCTQASSVTQTGNTTLDDCQSSSQDGSGCTVMESNTNSVGEAFANNGGGIYACEFAQDGINMWFFPRSEVPDGLANNDTEINTSSWGTPSASYPSSSCDIASHFSEQYLTLDITLCGDWAGSNSSYASTGCNLERSCYLDNVITEANNNYENAYFEIASLRTYLSDSVEDTSGNSSGGDTSFATKLDPLQFPFMNYFV